MTATDTPATAPTGDGGAAEMLAAMIRGHTPVRVEAGHALARQGEASEAAFVLLEGTVRVETETIYGAVSLARIHGPRLLGEIGALSELPRTASIIAVTDLLVCVIPRERLLAFGSEQPQFLTSVITQLGRQLQGMNQTLSLYSNALSALSSRDFDPRILDDLANPSPQLAEFSAAFRKFAEEIIRKRRGQDELESAAIIQQSYLPRLPDIATTRDALDLHCRMRAARNVGGDFYDFFLLGEDRLVICVGDVCGKGIPASLFMSVVVTILRMAAREEESVQSTITRANLLLERDNATLMFATAFYGVLDLRTGRLEYCNCGHNAPILVDGDGNMSTLPDSGLPLGLMPDRLTPARTVTLGPSDLLVLFTDGVTEAMNAANEEYSDKRLQEALRGTPGLEAEMIVDRIFKSVDAFVQGAEQSDDITCLALRCVPRSPAHPPERVRTP